MNSNELPFEVNTAGKINRFRRTVEQGEFSLLIESAVPGPQLPADEVLRQLKTQEETLLGITEIKCGLAILDRGSNREARSAVEYASELSEENRDRHVVYLSGKGRDMAEIDHQLVMAAASGCFNIAAVTGDLEDHPVYTDSGKIFQRLREDKRFFTGLTVNPYQYDPWAQTAQYSKLAARIMDDCGFFVTQMGWDTLKLQSLSWFLLNRNLYAPGFVRLLLPTPERMKNLLEHPAPGIIVGKELRSTMERELALDRTPFDVAQLRRLALQAVACKMLGFSGIQLAGAEHPRTAALAAKTIADALAKFTTFEEFLECYQSEMAAYEVNSFHLRFRLFDRVFRRPYPFDDPPRPRELPDPDISFREKFFLKFSGKDPLARRRQGIPTVGACPKHKASGPCGGVMHDGRCENGKNECVYRKWMRFACANDAITGIEKEMK